MKLYIRSNNDSYWPEFAWRVWVVTTRRSGSLRSQTEYSTENEVHGYYCMERVLGVCSDRFQLARTVRFVAFRLIDGVHTRDSIGWDIPFETP